MRLSTLAAALALLTASTLVLAGPVNINTADAETLSSELSGVGQNKAEAIVSYREQHGPYKNVEELTNVKGIGTATIDKNRSKIILE